MITGCGAKSLTISFKLTLFAILSINGITKCLDLLHVHENDYGGHAFYSSSFSTISFEPSIALTLTFVPTLCVSSLTAVQ